MNLDICDGTLSYCTVANNLYQEVNLMKPALSRRAVKGLFKATYGDTHNSEGNTESSTRGTSTKKNHRDKNKNKNKGTEDNKSSISKRVLTKGANSRVLDCSTPKPSSKRPHYSSGRVYRGYGGNYWIQFYFYLFPDLTLEGWEPNPEIEAFIKENLKEDPSILKEVKLQTKRLMVLQNKALASTLNQLKD
jgi:hypothetical protein